MIFLLQGFKACLLPHEQGETFIYICFQRTAWVWSSLHGWAPVFKTILVLAAKSEAISSENTKVLIDIFGPMTLCKSGLDFCFSLNAVSCTNFLPTWPHKNFRKISHQHSFRKAWVIQHITKWAQGNSVASHHSHVPTQRRGLNSKLASYS